MDGDLTPRRLASIFQTECRLNTRDPIVVGVSGGADSMCLMHVLMDVGYQVLIAHFDHQLRAEAVGEAQRVAEHAAQLGVPCLLGSGDVRAHALSNRKSIEEAARSLRYGFLFRIARENSAQAVAVGHTADDQVETVLMHFIRGAALAGLAGMGYRTVLPSFDRAIPVVRPLLNLWHRQTLAYCSERGLRPTEDLSNASLVHLRNRIRHDLIPILQSYNPAFRRSALRMTSALRADQAALNETADLDWQKCVTHADSDRIVFDAAALQACRPAIQASMVRRAAMALDPDLDFDHLLVERWLALVAGTGPRQADFKREIRLLRVGSALILGRARADLLAGLFPQLADANQSVPIRLPAELDLGHGWTMSGESRSAQEAVERINEEGAGRIVDANCLEAWLDEEALAEPLVVRSRLPGDRFFPLGLQGRGQKVSDFMIKQKVPSAARGRWPLLCSGTTVLWIPGYRVADPAKVTAKTRRAAFFRLSRFGPKTFG